MGKTIVFKAGLALDGWQDSEDSLVTKNLALMPAQLCRNAARCRVVGGFGVFWGGRGPLKPACFPRRWGRRPRW